jgi:hypothetical protein
MLDIWLPSWLQISNLFQPLEFAGHYFKLFQDWPSLKDLNQWNKQQNTIEFVRQLPKKQVVASTNQYEAMIYLKQQVQTRTQNWHDFFNAVIWRIFPKTKQQINYHQHLTLNYRHQNKIQQRLPIENFLTHFDECGLIILSTNTRWFNLIRSHAWEEIFWHKRSALQQEVRFITFGHSIYEKGIKPYLGLTAKAVFINLPVDSPLDYIDYTLGNLLKNNNSPIYQQKLQPVPLLGIPGWYSDNQKQSFYNNTKYFRAKASQIN